MHHKSLLLGLIFFLCGVSNALAQTSATEEWQTNVSLGFNLTRGNSDTLLINTNLQVEKDYSRDHWRFEIDGSYGETEDETTQKQAKALADYKHLVSDRAYFAFGGRANFDEVAEIDYRYSINPALGYFLVKDEKIKFNIEAGPSYVFEKLDGLTDDYLNARIADRFEWTISDSAKLFQSLEYYHSVEDADKFLITAELGIETLIVENLSLVLVAKDNYDNRPAEDTKKNDLEVIAALKVRL